MTLNEENVAVAASMRNHHLAVAKDTLREPESYFILTGSTLFEVSEELQVLPTYAGITADGEIVLGYGLESPASEETELPYDYPLVVCLGANGRVSHVNTNS